MLGLQQTGPGFWPHRQPSRCGQSPALPNRLGFLLEKMSEHVPCDVRELAARVGVDAAHAYGGFMGQLTAWCEHHQIPYEGIPVGTIKKHATGKGNAGKEEMIASVQARGHQPVDDNEADAIALAYLARDRQTTQEA